MMKRGTIGILVIFIVLLLAVAAIAYYSAARSEVAEPSVSNPSATTTNGGLVVRGQTQFNDQSLGLSFNYSPERYELTEFGGEAEEPFLRAITLMPVESPPPPEGGEGPPAINIFVYELETTDLLSWLARPESNFSLSDGSYTQTQISGREAVIYRSSGLYETINVAAISAGRVYAFSVGYLTPEDEGVADFYSLLSSVGLE